MKRELFIHFSFLFSFFVLITLVNRLFNLTYWPFWIGGLFGMILPDLDHLIYVYLSKPTDLSSQRFVYLVQNKGLRRAVGLLYETRNERRELIFHSILFQLIFLILTFWVLSSTNSYFGRGVVLSFSLHLLIDQIIDITEMGNLDNWFNNLPFKISADKCKFYCIFVGVVILLMGFLM